MTVIDEAQASAADKPISQPYAWVMVVVAALAMVATLPGRTHGLGMITERLLNDPSLELTRSGFGAINLWATLLGSLFCLGIGAVVDRRGIRGTLTFVTLSLGLVVVAMAATPASWDQAAAGAMPSFCREYLPRPLFFLGILLTRGFGQSALSVISITIIGKWFPRNVSFPMAVYSVLMALGFAGTAVFGKSYADVNWRQFWSVIGWSVTALACVFLLVARDRTPENDASLLQNSNEDSTSDYEHGQAVRTPMFWVCSFAISFYGLITSGSSLFSESILVDQGFTKADYYDSLMWGMMVGVVAKLITGALGLRVRLNRLLSVALLTLTASLVWLTHLTSRAAFYGYVVVYATAGSMLTVLFFSAWSQLYGRQHLGKIQGTAQMITVLFSAIGPALFGYIRDRCHSYVPLIWVLAGISLAAAVTAWLTPLPVRAARHPCAASGDID